MARCIVVTGAAGALGSVVAKHLVAGGDAVAAVDRPAAAARLEALARDVGPRCAAVPLDVTSAAAWSTLLTRIEQELGVPAGAALVAGGWGGGDPFATER